MKILTNQLRKEEVESGQFSHESDFKVEVEAKWNSYLFPQTCFFSQSSVLASAEELLKIIDNTDENSALGDSSNENDEK